MNDLAVLALAAKQQRVLVSHDVGTMPRHFQSFRLLSTSAKESRAQKRTPRSSGRLAKDAISSLTLREQSPLTKTSWAMTASIYYLNFILANCKSQP